MEGAFDKAGQHMIKSMHHGSKIKKYGLGWRRYLAAKHMRKGMQQTAKSKKVPGWAKPDDASIAMLKSGEKELLGKAVTKTAGAVGGVGVAGGIAHDRLAKAKKKKK